MRLIIIVLLFSVQANSQINRSAMELARENAQDFLVNKIFKNQNYRPVNFGELEPFKQYDPNIAWVIEHRCEVGSETHFSGRDTTILTSYKFVFYLDRKLKVFRAESFQGNLLADEEKPAVMAKRE